MNYSHCDFCKVGSRDIPVGRSQGFFEDTRLCEDCARKHGIIGDKMSCKVCMREYKDRPNDLCNNYLHWQAYVYELEIKGSISKENA